MTTMGHEFTPLAGAYYQIQVDPYPEGSAARASKLAHCRFLQRFEEWSANFWPGSSADAIVCEEAALDFLRTLSKSLQCNSVRNHCTGIKAFLAACRANRALRSTALGDVSLPALKNAEAAWGDHSRRAAKQARKETRVRLKTEPFNSAPIKDIAAALKGRGAIRSLAALRAGLRENKLLAGMPRQARTSWEYLLRFFACLLSLHGIRRCVYENIIPLEIMSAIYCDGYYVIRCQDHKTADTTGPAAFALREDSYLLLREFATLRQAIASKSQKLFITINGGDKPEPCAGIFTFNEVRKTIETFSYLIRGNSVVGAVSNYLSHTEPVAKAHYRYITDAVVVAGSRHTEDVIAQILAKDLILASDLHLKAREASNNFFYTLNLDSWVKDNWPFEFVGFKRLTDETRAEIYPKVRDKARAYMTHKLANSFSSPPSRLQLEEKLSAFWRDDIADLCHIIASKIKK